MAYISASPLSKVLHANPSFPSVSFNDCKSGFVHTLHTARTFVSAVPFPAARHSTRSLKCVARAAVQESRDALKVDQIRAVGSDRRQVYTVQIQKPLGIVFRGTVIEAPCTQWTTFLLCTHHSFMWTRTEKFVLLTWHA